MEPYIYERDELRSIAGSAFPLTVFSVAGEAALAPLHSHKFYELVIVTGGDGTYRDENRSYHIKAGDILMLRPGMAHEYCRQNHLAVTNVMWLDDDLKFQLYDLTTMPGWNSLFEIEPLMRPRSDFLPLNLEGALLVEAERLVYHMESELKSGEPGSQLMAIGLFSQLLVFLCRCYAQSSIPRYQELQSLDRVLLYMNKHFSEQIPRSKLASLVSKSESSFYRSFCRIIGCTPSAYLNNIRLRNAEQLLRNTASPISEVALQCGFYDSSYFCTCFNKVYGMPPHRYRNQLRIKN